MSEKKLEEINLNLLLSLSALLHEENVTQAARRIGLTQSAMSRNLRSLRTLFEDEILVRIGNQMHATSFALALKPHLEQALADLKRVVNSAGSFDPTTATGRVRIACPSHIALILGAQFAKNIALSAPHLDLRFEDIPDMKLRKTIAEGVDVAIGPAVDFGATLESRLLFTDGFSCLVRKEHPISDRKFDLDAYLSLQHILISPTGRGASQVDDLLGDRKRRVFIQVSSFLLAPAIVAKSDLVLTGPTSVIRNAETLFAVTKLPLPFELPPLRIATFWDPRRNEDPRLQWILSQIYQAVEKKESNFLEKKRLPKEPK